MLITKRLYHKGPRQAMHKPCAFDQGVPATLNSVAASHASAVRSRPVRRLVALWELASWLFQSVSAFFLSQRTARYITNRTVQHVLSLVPALLDVTLECARVERLQKLKGAEQFRRYTHDRAPIVELSAILWLQMLAPQTLRTASRDSDSHLAPRRP